MAVDQFASPETSKKFGEGTTPDKKVNPAPIPHLEAG